MSKSISDQLNKIISGCINDIKGPINPSTSYKIVCATANFESIKLFFNKCPYDANFVEAYQFTINYLETARKYELVEKIENSHKDKFEKCKKIVSVKKYVEICTLNDQSLYIEKHETIEPQDPGLCISHYLINGMLDFIKNVDFKINPVATINTICGTESTTLFQEYYRKWHINLEAQKVLTINSMLKYLDLMESRGFLTKLQKLGILEEVEFNQN